MTRQRFFKILPYVGILIMFLIWRFDNWNYQNQVSSLQSNVKISQDSVRHLIASNGQLVSRVNSMTLTVDELGKQGSLLAINNDNLKNKVGSLNNLITYYKGQLVSQGQVTSKGQDTAIHYHRPRDTTKVTVIARKFIFNNGNLSLNQVYNPVSDSLLTQYQYRTDVELINYRTRKKLLLFGKNETLADVILSDPNASIKTAQSIVIKSPPKQWYQTNAFKYSVGIVLGVVLIK